MAEEESGFSFVDRRHAAPETPPAEPAGAPAEPGFSSEADDENGSLPALQFRDRLLMCIDVLHQGAWIDLGLVANPATGLVAKRIDDARAAIDAVSFLAEKAMVLVDEATQKEIRGLVTDLRLNFVRQANGA
jgi:hypothetical protein